MRAGYFLLIGRWSDEPFFGHKPYMLDLLVDLLRHSIREVNVFEEGLNFIKKVLIECSEFSFRRKVPFPSALRFIFRSSA